MNLTEGKKGNEGSRVCDDSTDKFRSPGEGVEVRMPGTDQPIG